ncbi:MULTISPECIES: OmpA family protein [Vibrio]|uniref:OmpA-like domain-containing protein n=1 Tax=Vibrio ezurae NBRC 102218 TaxID=1219080 RepID=U3CNN9_9VIBR|nr:MULTISPECIES: OmpA family protein [Vibrio]GAD79738.1 hypothetical protein VEZ01S_20_00100 [Vibrio ezurae NBRC 102218]
MASKKYSDDGSYILSVSDIMSGLIFVFIILLAVFMISLMSANEDSLRKENEYQANIAKLKSREAKLVEKEQQANKMRVSLEQKNAELLKKEAASQVLQAQLEEQNDKLISERNAARGYLSGIVENSQTRVALLNTIESTLQKHGLVVDMDMEHGVMRLGEDAILFPTGKATLNNTYLERLQTVSNVLAQILPCYADEQPSNLHCLPETKGKLNSVFIEGHTDNVPIRGALLNQFADNRDLSTARANYTFNKLVNDTELLKLMQNKQHQPIFSVSGYGDDRPVTGHAHLEPTSDPKNRRIDFRFIMSPPSTTDVQKALDGNLG